MSSTRSSGTVPDRSKACRQPGRREWGGWMVGGGSEGEGMMSSTRSSGTVLDGYTQHAGVGSRLVVSGTW